MVKIFFYNTLIISIVKVIIIITVITNIAVALDNFTLIIMIFLRLNIPHF